MTGHIRRRGAHSWELKIAIGRDANGKRQTRYESVKGTRKDAERRLTELLHQRDGGTLVSRNTVTVGDYIRSWMDTAPLSAKTLERYREILAAQIDPHIGNIPLQKLRRDDLKRWHQALLKNGAKDGSPLAPKTIRQCHGIVAKALAVAVDGEILSRNVASRMTLPKIETEEIQILSVDEIGAMLKRLEGHRLRPVAELAIGTGARRGELLALRWSDIDLDAGTLRIERSLEETRAGLRFKVPKTKHSRRVIALAPDTIDGLRIHRRQQLEQRMALGLGTPPSDALVFPLVDGRPWSPDGLSDIWRNMVKNVTFHSLRHFHASALIAAGVDVVSVSRRLGHSSPNITLSVYAHRFKNADRAAAAAIQSVLRK